MPVTTVGNDGTVITIYEDGSSDITFPDGSQRHTNSDGSRIDVNADGTDWTITDSNGDSFSFRWEESEPEGEEDNTEPEPEPEPVDTGERLGPDDDGNRNDAGWRPRFWGNNVPKDPTDVSDTRAVVRIYGTGGGPVDPTDKNDTSIRMKLPGGGAVVVDAWEKVGPKYRPLFNVYQNKYTGKNYSFNAMGLQHFISAVIRSTSKKKAKSLVTAKSSK